MKRKIAFITGITGQDGSYLAEFLLEKGYEVHGIKRRSSLINTSRIDHIYDEPFNATRNLYLHYGDLSDSGCINKLISHILPDEIYNLGAQSHVAVSFYLPEYTADINALGTLRILDAIKAVKDRKNIKFYQASSSELFGLVQEIPQKETTPFYPRSPYATAKLFAYWITINYRESYDLYACNGILFNHESPRRGETFVTRKITQALARIYYGLQKILHIGNLNAKRDWGHARDYIKMQWLMLQQDSPRDYVIASGKQYTVREFIISSCRIIGIEIEFQGKGLLEVGIIKKINKNNIYDHSKNDLKIGDILVKVEKEYFRPNEVESLLGDSSKAKEDLKWVPETSFEMLVSEMMKSDLCAARDIKILKNNNSN